MAGVAQSFAGKTGEIKIAPNNKDVVVSTVMDSL